MLELTPSNISQEHEIAASNMADLGGVFNPQQQFPVTWPQHPQIALAYVDQLARENEDALRFESLRTSLEMALVRVESNRKDRRLARTLTTHAAELEDSGLRQTKLKTLLLNIVQRLK